MSEHQVFDDITKYDVFLGIAGHKQISAESLRQAMWLKDNAPLEDCLNELSAEKLITLRGGEYVASGNSRSQTLLNLLSFALSVDLDYNYYINDNIRNVLAGAYGRYAFSLANLKGVPPAEAYKIIKRLCVDYMCVAYTYYPLAGKLVRNRFYDLLCDYWGVKPHKARFYERKVKIDGVILQHFFDRSQNNKKKLVAASKLYCQHGEHFTKPTPSKLQLLLKHDIIPLNPELFDTDASERGKLAEDKVNKNVEELKNFNLEHLMDYHALVMYGKIQPVEYRNFEVEIRNNRGFQPAAAKDIEVRMKALGDNYKKLSRTVKSVPKALELAAYVYNEIVHVQPFADGNTRTARLALLHVLKIFKTGVDTIPRSYDMRLMGLAKGQAKRNDASIVEALKELTLNRINEQDFKEMSQYV